MKKILWVEDDYFRLKGLMRPLEKKGFIVDFAEDYPSFVKKLDQNYDLYVVDLILPQKEIGEKIKDGEFIELPGVKIIDEIDKLGKPIIVLTVVSDPALYEDLKKKNSVKKVLNKGNIFPTDFAEDVLEILGIRQ